MLKRCDDLVSDGLHVWNADVLVKQCHKNIIAIILPPFGKVPSGRVWEK